MHNFPSGMGTVSKAQTRVHIINNTTTICRVLLVGASIFSERQACRSTPNLVSKGGLSQRVSVGLLRQGLLLGPWRLCKRLAAELSVICQRACLSCTASPISAGPNFSFCLRDVESTSLNYLTVIFFWGQVLCHANPGALWKVQEFIFEGKIEDILPASYCLKATTRLRPIGIHDA